MEVNYLMCPTDLGLPPHLLFERAVEGNRKVQLNIANLPKSVVSLWELQHAFQDMRGAGHVYERRVLVIASWVRSLAPQRIPLLSKE